MTAKHHPWSVHPGTVPQRDELRHDDVLGRTGLDLVHAGTVFRTEAPGDLAAESPEGLIAVALARTDEHIVRAIEVLCRGGHFRAGLHPIAVAMGLLRTTAGIAQLVAEDWYDADLQWLPEPGEEGDGGPVQPPQSVGRVFEETTDTLDAALRLDLLSCVHPEVEVPIEAAMVALLIEARWRLSEVATGLCVRRPALVAARGDEGWREWREDRT